MKTLKLGDVGEDVAKWQAIVGVDVDSHFGPITEAATRAWQRAHELEPDGVVGALSWKAAFAQADTEPPADLEILRGCDVSAVQGVLPDSTWKTMAEASLRFAIMRGVVGNEGGDVAIAENMVRAKAHGIEAWPYVFAFPLPHLDPRRQAEHFVEKLGAMRIDVRAIALDLEWPPPEEWQKDPDPSTDVWPDGTKKQHNAKGQVLVDTWKKWGCSASQIRDWGIECLARGEELTGKPWMLYTYRYFWRRIEGQKTGEYARYPLWLADYTFKSVWPSPELAHSVKAPAPWDKITICQFDGTGGLTLPDGRDADFNVLLGGEGLLADLLSSAQPKAVETVIDPLLAAQQARGWIVDEEIARYRRERLDDEETA